MPTEHPLAHPSARGVRPGPPTAANSEMKHISRVQERDGNSTIAASTAVGSASSGETVHYTSICSLRKSEAVHNGSPSTYHITKTIPVKPNQTDPGSPCGLDPYESDLCTCSVSQDCLQITSVQVRQVPPWCSLFSIFPVIYHLDMFRSEAEFPNREFKCVIKVSHKDGLQEPVFKYRQWKITVNLTSSQIKLPHTVSAFFPHRVRWFFKILIHFFFKSQLSSNLFSLTVKLRIYLYMVHGMCIYTYICKATRFQ